MKPKLRISAAILPLPKCLHGVHRDSYPLNSRLGESESRSGCFGTGENLLPLPGIESRFLDLQRIVFIFPWCCGPTWARASSFLRFLDHTQRRTTVGRTPLDEWSVRHKDLYLTTHNTHPSPPPTWDSHPQSQQASGRRPTLLTAQPLRPAHCLITIQRKLSWLLGIVFVHVTRVHELKGYIPAPSLNTYVVWNPEKGLYAVHWTETSGPRLGLKCNNGEPCSARRQGQRWDVVIRDMTQGNVPVSIWGTGSVCRASLGPLKYLVQWVPRSVCPGIVSRSVKLTAQVHQWKLLNS